MTTPSIASFGNDIFINDSHQVIRLSYHNGGVSKSIKLTFREISLAQEWNSIVKIAQRSGTFEFTYGTAAVNTMAKGQGPGTK